MAKKQKLLPILLNIVRAIPNEWKNLKRGLALFFWEMIYPVSCVVFGLWLCYTLERKIYRMIFPLTASEMHDEAISLLKKHSDVSSSSSSSSRRRNNNTTNQQQRSLYQHNYHQYNVIISTSTDIHKNDHHARALSILSQCIQTYPNYIQSYVTLASEYLYGDCKSSTTSTSNNCNDKEQEYIQKSLEIIQKGLLCNPKHEELLKLELEASAMMKTFGTKKKDDDCYDKIRYMMSVGQDLG